MNIILFESIEASGLLPRSDPRARHILEVLRREVGDRFDAGVIDGPRGKGTLLSIEPEVLAIEFTWGEPPPPLHSLTVAIGLPRPSNLPKDPPGSHGAGSVNPPFLLDRKGGSELCAELAMDIGRVAITPDRGCPAGVQHAASPGFVRQDSI